jgi:hypothetical protein
MLFKIDDKELSWMYYIGTARAAAVTEELYNSLHTPDGKPIDDPEVVKSLVDLHIKQVKAEVDLIKTAAEERRGKDDHYTR